MRRVFADAGFMVALEVRTDQHHVAAQAQWKQVQAERWQLFTTSYVLDEAVTFLNSRGGHNRAVRLGEHLLHSPEVAFIHVDEALLEAAWRYFRRHSDKRYSLTDCVSFIVMEREGLREVLTFDHHFEQAGFMPLP